MKRHKRKQLQWKRRRCIGLISPVIAYTSIPSFPEFPIMDLMREDAELLGLLKKIDISEATPCAD